MAALEHAQRWEASRKPSARGRGEMSSIIREPNRTVDAQLPDRVPVSALRAWIRLCRQGNIILLNLHLTHHWSAAHSMDL